MTTFALNEPVYPVQRGWTSVRLGEVLTLLNRGAAPVYSEESTGVLVYNQKCTRPDRTVDLDLGRPHTPVDDLPGHRALLQPGDVLVNSTGKGTLGRAARFPGAEVPVLADGHVSILRPRPEVLDSQFLAYALGTDDFYDFANAVLAVGATNQTELNREVLAATRFGLPPLVTQRAIVARLDRECGVLEALLAEQERLRGLTLARYRALLTRIRE